MNGYIVVNVCMDMNGWMWKWHKLDGWMDVLIDAWMDGWMDGWIDGYEDGWLCGWMGNGNVGVDGWMVGR